MAKIVENNKGFKVIEISRIEMVSRLGSFGICDSCNRTAANGYYVAVLNKWFCKECYNDWLSRAVNYPQDRAIENRNFEYYKKMFGL